MKKLIYSLIISFSLISCDNPIFDEEQECFVLDPVALKEGDTQWLRLQPNEYRHINTHYVDYIQYEIEDVTYQTSNFTLVIKK